MRWKGRKQSTNFEDRRGQRVSRGSAAGIAGGLGIGRMLFGLFARGSGKTKLLIIAGLVIAFFMFKGTVLEVLGLAAPGSTQPTSEEAAPIDDEMSAYLRTLVGDNETIWAEQYPKATGNRFKPATMVVYTGRTRTPGGIADAGMGPFYLPANEKIYLDPTFFDQMAREFKAGGDFAQAYVVAHEYGHHIQHLMGILNDLHSKNGKVSKTAYNRLSVRVELHADFLAGFMAHHAQNKFKTYLEQGDIEEAMNAARKIGDDNLQKNHGSGRVNPDSFTHGTSKQRAHWFNQGLKTGNFQTGQKIFTLPYNQL